MGGGGTKQTTQQGPWKEAAPYYKDLFSSAGTAYGATPKTPYTGPFYADPNKTQLEAVGQLTKAAPGLATGVPEIRNYGLDVLGGKYLDLNNNPYFGAAAEGAIRPVQQKYQQEIIPQINSNAIQLGAYGGGRQGLALGSAAEGFTRAAGDITGQMALNAYNTERGYQQAAPGLFGIANQLALAYPQALAAAGEQMYQWDQNKVNEAIAKWNELKSAPWAGLGEYANILGTGGFSSTTTKTQGASPAQQFAQTVLGLPALATAFS